MAKVRKQRGGRRTHSLNRVKRWRILVVCAGKVTEREYFSGLRSAVASSSICIDVVTEDKSPHYVVAEAARRGATGDYDQVWCVMDVDNFDIQSAVAKARRGGIQLAISNPCFDLWLLLHFVEHRSFVNDFTAMKTLLRKHVPDYASGDHGKHVVFDDYWPHIEDAKVRARRLDEGHAELYANPSSGVWRLVDRIMENAK